MKDEKNCPCCPNHCEVNSLRCGRGREYFSQGESSSENTHGKKHDKDESSMTKEERVLFKIQKCGHELHHSKDIQSVSFLSEDEQVTLIELLSKCLEHWN